MNETGTSKRKSEKRTKPWYRSKGVNGGIMTIAGVMLALYAQSKGVPLSEEQAAQAVATGYETFMSIAALLAGGGGVLGLIGRLLSTKRIK